MVKAALIVVFVIPMVLMILYGIAEAQRLKYIDEARAYARRESRKAMMREAARRRVRGTPRRRAV